MKTTHIASLSPHFMRHLRTVFTNNKLAKLVLFTGLTFSVNGMANANETLIKNALIVSDQGIAQQTQDILIKDKLISKIADNISAKPTTRVIDAAGKPVSAGIFNANSQLGVREVSSVASTVDASTDNEHITASLRIVDAFNPSSVAIAYNRTLGLTHTLIQPSSGAKLFAGVASVVNLSTANPVEVTQAAMVVSLGEHGSELAGGSRAAAMAMLREGIEDARDYAKNKSSFNEGSRRAYSLSRHDLEALIPVVNRRLPLLVRVERASDIEAVLAFAKKQKLSLILSGVSEAWLVADKIAAAKVPVIFDPINNLPSSYEALGTRLDNAKILHEAGVTIMFTGMGWQNTHNAYLVRQSAGNAVANGLPYEAAIAAITTNPAKIFGLPSYGQLKEGKAATLVVWSDDPLEVMSNPRNVFIDGDEYPLVSRATRLRDKYYQQLLTR